MWQWDTGRKVKIIPEENTTIDEVHFSNTYSQEAVVVIPETDGTTGDIIAEIPNILLQQFSPIKVYSVMRFENGEITTREKQFSIRERKKPSDYVYTEAEVRNYEALEKRIKNLEENGGNSSGGISEEKDPTVAEWAKQPKKPAYTADEVGAASKEEVKKLSEEIADIKENSTGGGSVVEPMEDDIPKVFFSEAIPQTKDDATTKFRYISKTKDVSGYAEFKAQGNSSMSFPKKNMTVKMYADEALEEKLKVDFKEWGKQSKHVYKANWIDLTHSRNIVSARLWADVVKSRSNYSALPELLRTSPNQGAVDGFPIKVYSKGVYQGRYTLNIPKDAWMTNMDKTLYNHCILCGENYSSGCFREAAMINGGDWSDEVHETVPTSIKTRWNEVISFVMNSTDEEFVANLENYFFVDSLIDYFVFGMVSCGLDAFGKNQLYFTYDGIKWIASMYDMDSTWGLYSNGNRFVPANYSRAEFEDFAGERMGNLLYIRLSELFYARIQARYRELKQGALSVTNIINHFERFTDIASLDLVKEDYASTTGGGKFTGIPLQDTNNIQQIRQFVIDRYSYCDEYIASLTPEGVIRATSVTLDKTTLSFADTTAQTIVATVEPSDTTEVLVWTSSDENIARVANGVVTPIMNGSAIITATVGSVSAKCEVVVNIRELTTYTITRNLTNCTSSNSATSILEGSAYEETITPNEGYMLEGASVTVTMNGSDITSTAYNNGKISISEVTGNIVISVESVAKVATLLYELPEPTTFDGSTTYIDTGVQLAKEDVDFTIIFSMDAKEWLGDSASVFTCASGESYYDGYAMHAGTRYVLRAYNKYLYLDNVPNRTDANPPSGFDRSKVAITRKAGTDIMSVKTSYLGSVVDYEVGGISWQSVESNLLIGCWQKSDGSRSHFWGGELYDFKVYDMVLSDEEILEHFAFYDESSNVYSLPEPTVFDGSAMYIDTGVRLFNTAKDFTLFFHADTSDTSNGNYYSVFYCYNDSGSFPGLVYQKTPSQNNYSYRGNDDDASKEYTSTKNPFSESVKGCVVCENGVITRIFSKVGDDVMAELEVKANSYTAIKKKVFLGCRMESTADRFWKGTIYDFKVYDRVLSDDEITALFE